MTNIVPFHPRTRPAPPDGRANSTEEAGRKALYRITEAMILLSMSRTVIYEQIRARRLRTVTQGRTRLVPAAAIDDYVALLEREAAQGVAV